MAEVIPSPIARADLVDIRKYSLEQFGPDVADAYFLGFEQAFDLLARYPQAGEARPELGRGIRCLTHHKHRIFYTADEDEVWIIRIIHHARDAKRALN